MGKKLLYTEAYRVLDQSTPLSMDCGKLCGKACCKDLEEESGMHLFPGEEIMYLDKPDWIKIKAVDGFSEGAPKILLATCTGLCDRNLRPLSCRIFPLTPYITPNDILQVKMDPRGKALCPLARYSSRNRLHPQFVKNVRLVFKELIEDQDIRSYIVQLSRMLDEYIRLPWFQLR